MNLSHHDANRRSPMATWLWFSLLVILLDQLSKYQMGLLLPLCQYGNCATIEVLPVFRLIMLHNDGAAFSFLSDAGGWQRWFLLVISSVFSLILLVWILRLKRTERWMAVSLSLILGGAVGNLIDRIHQGYVIDFLLVHYEDAYFPAFNLADSAITLGAAVMIVDMMFVQRRSGPREPPGEPN